jgi:acyl-CoA thioesterase-1
MSRWATLSILSGTLLCTAGCHGPSSSQLAPAPAQDYQEVAPASDAQSSVPPESNKPDINDSRPVVVCFGDSLTAGHGASLGASYPDFLQKDLDRDGYHVHVINEGISGDTTKDGLDRLAEVIALKPQVVVLEFGGNDGLRGLNLESTRANLATMIQGLKNAHIKVVIAGMTLPPDYGPDYISRFTGNYASLGKQFNLPVLPFLLTDVYGVPGMMQQDRTHATDQGNAVVAKNVLPYVEKLMKK